MKAYVVTKAELALSVLRAVLPKELLKATTLRYVGPRSNQGSVARTLLVEYQKPLAVIEETLSVDERMVRERRESVKESLSLVSLPDQTKVILMIPRTEILFFQVPGLLEKVLGVPIPRDAALISRFAPHEALELMLTRPGGPHTPQELLDVLGEEEKEALRLTGPIQELMAYLNQAVEGSAQPVRK